MELILLRRPRAMCEPHLLTGSSTFRGPPLPWQGVREPGWHLSGSRAEDSQACDTHVPTTARPDPRPDSQRLPGSARSRQALCPCGPARSSTCFSTCVPGYALAQPGPHPGSHTFTRKNGVQGVICQDGASPRLFWGSWLPAPPPPAGRSLSVDSALPPAILSPILPAKPGQATCYF